MSRARVQDRQHAKRRRKVVRGIVLILQRLKCRQMKLQIFVGVVAYIFKQQLLANKHFPSRLHALLFNGQLLLNDMHMLRFIIDPN